MTYYGTTLLATVYRSDIGCESAAARCGTSVPDKGPKRGGGRPLLGPSSPSRACRYPHPRPSIELGHLGHLAGSPALTRSRAAEENAQMPNANLPICQNCSICALESRDLGLPSDSIDSLALTHCRPAKHPRRTPAKGRALCHFGMIYGKGANLVARWLPTLRRIRA